MVERGGGGGGDVKNERPQRVRLRAVPFAHGIVHRAHPASTDAACYPLECVRAASKLLHGPGGPDLEEGDFVRLGCELRLPDISHQKSPIPTAKQA